MSLLGFLLSGTTSERSRRSLLAQLSTSRGWPADAALQKLALEHGVAPVSPPTPGEILLVSVGADGLWVLTSKSGSSSDVLEFRGTATASARLAQRIVTRDLPLYDELSSLHRLADWVAKPFAIPCAEAPWALDGESFGLGFALATASLLLNLPLRMDLIASATLGPDGALGPVEGISRKIALVLEEALGIRVFLVEASQREEAENARTEILRQHQWDPERPWLEVVSIATFREAFQFAFPDAVAQMRKRWEDAPRAQKLSDELFRAAIYGTPLVLSWRAISDIAEALSQSLADETTLLRLKRVRAIAERHGGAGKGAVLDWPAERELAGMHRFLQSHLLAQVVQSAADGSEDPVSYARKALGFVRNQMDRSHEDLVLLGAIGRAFAAGGADNEAVRFLREAADGWKEIDAEHESSFALCELLRLLGLARDRASVEALCATCVPGFERLPRASELSQGFVRVAAGRALVQVGCFEAALDYLNDDRRWPPLPEHAEAARVRWLARALDGVGNIAEAQRRRAVLRAVSKCESDQSLLAELDEALARDTAVESVLAKLCVYDEVRRVLSRCPSGERAACFLAEHYRY